MIHICKSIYIKKDKQFKQFFVWLHFQIKCQKIIREKTFTAVKKLGHKSTAVLGKLGSKAVDVATSKAANYLVGAAAAALL